MRVDRVRGAWKAPRSSRITVDEYGIKWIAQRHALKVSTRAEYESCWRNHVSPYLGTKRLDAVSPTMIRDWHPELVTSLRVSLRAEDEARISREGKLAKTSRSHRRPRMPSEASVRDGSATAARAYRLLHSVYVTAVEDDLVSLSPCRIRGASAGRAAERPVLSIPEVQSLALEVPDRYEALVHA